MDLDWYYFGDSLCLTQGKQDFVQKLVDSSDGDDGSGGDEAAADQRLKSLFRRLGQGHPQGQEAPLLGAIREAVRATPGRSGQNARYEWDPQKPGGLDVRIVRDMPDGNEREHLLTPTALYVSWGFFADAKRKGMRLGRYLQHLNVTVPRLPSKALKGPHLWVDAVLDAGDVMAEHLPDKLPADSDEARHALGVMAYLRERNGRPPLEPGAPPPLSVGQWPSDVANAEALEIGDFGVETDSNRRRDESYVRIKNGTLTLVLGTDQNKSFLYCPWPCGALTGC